MKITTQVSTTTTKEVELPKYFRKTGDPYMVMALVSDKYFVRVENYTSFYKDLKSLLVPAFHITSIEYIGVWLSNGIEEISKEQFMDMASTVIGTFMNVINDGE